MKVTLQQFLRLPRLPIPPLRHVFWSGRRDSNSRPPPWQGGILPLNYFRPYLGAEAQNRTGDTRIFSPLLYRLSYLGTQNIVAGSHIGVKQALGCIQHQAIQKAGRLKGGYSLGSSSN